MSKYFACSIALLAANSLHAYNDPSREDATLNDIYFIDAHVGWAVGEQGVIWHTSNGGASWQFQSSGTACSLRSVFFADRSNGWIAGGQALPYSRGSRGLVLATSDGGQTWQPYSWDQYPRLHRIQFLNPKVGWAWGETSEYYPSGLFGSDNSGRVWSPASGSMGVGWLAGSFTGPDHGVLAGVGGATAIVLNRAVTPVAMGGLGGRSIRSVKAGGGGTFWAVADGGVILRSDSRGASWTVLTAGLPAESAAIFDWRGVHSIAQSVWVVGRPGTVVLHSPDSGSTWQAAATGQYAPLETVWFHDRQQGWAAGALGTILHTRDGGRTWQVQRRGGERAAILAVHANPLSTPLLAHVQLGAELGYLTADLAVVSESPEVDLDKNRLALRLADAIRVAGGSRSESEWRYPAVPVATSIAQVLAAWNRQSDGRAIQDLERRLVIALRTWRPDVVLGESPDPAASSDPAAAIVSQVLERAVRSAADPGAFPELIDSAGLGPWSTSKFLVAVSNGSAADIRIDSSELSRRPDWAGRPLDDQAALALSLLAESYRATNSELALRQVINRLDSANDSVMSGIVLEPGGPARRRLIDPVEISDAQRRAVQTRRNLLAVLGRAQAQPILAQQLNAQVGGLLRDLPPDQAGNLMYHLARTHFMSGRWSDTRDLLEKLLNDQPNHLIAAEAQRWLVQFYASSEARHRERVASVAGQTLVTPRMPANAAGPASANSQPAARLSLEQRSGAVGALGSMVPWSSGAVERAKSLLQTAPLVWSEPHIQFAVASAQRAIGNVKDADKFYTTFSYGRDHGAWSDAARSERWIRDRQGMPAKPIVISQRAPAVPRLDGVLDDAVWKSPAISFAEQQGQESEATTRLHIAHDQQFLYIAIECSAAGGAPAPPHRPRTRDMDLSDYDRVDLYFDLDRDYCTYYRLSIDERGCVFEDCWGDRSWDPTWYVASQGDDGGYRIEAAIPLGELCGVAPADGTVWAFNAVRIVPNQSVSSWSRPAAVTPRPEGMGLLFFSDGPSSPLPRSAVAN